MAVTVTPSSILYSYLSSPLLFLWTSFLPQDSPLLPPCHMYSVVLSFCLLHPLKTSSCPLMVPIHMHKLTLGHLEGKWEASFLRNIKECAAHACGSGALPGGTWAEITTRAFLSGSQTRALAPGGRGTLIPKSTNTVLKQIYSKLIKWHTWLQWTALLPGSVIQSAFKVINGEDMLIWSWILNSSISSLFIACQVKHTFFSIP